MRPSPAHRAPPNVSLAARAAFGLMLASILLVAGGCGPESDLPGSEIRIGDRARIEGWRDAYREGVDYRAVGSDPSWSLEITVGEAVEFEAEDGRRLVAPPPDEVPEGHRSIFFTEAGDRELIVSVSRGVCRDSIRGSSFDTRVTVTLDDERYHGCGRTL